MMAVIEIRCRECQGSLGDGSVEVEITDSYKWCESCGQGKKISKSFHLCSEACMSKHFPKRDPADIGPNPRRVGATANYCHEYDMPGVGKVWYAEYGGGAELVDKKGNVVADFPNHLTAEAFLHALLKASRARPHG